uniref:putative F-box protein At3g10240 n=1 Tax=Erigeron canadensis TaxID=72917 RepID=UPI001CB91FFB|nr:putative F-box protein At3g10240 [Erigeron canadensis]
MSDFIPFEMQIEIINRLPAKSAVKFRLVSKPWNSYIGSSEFIVAHHHQNSHRQQPPRLRLWCKGPPRKRHVSPNCHVKFFEDKYVTVFDDDTFYQQDFTLKALRITKQLTISRVIDCSHGLVCLYDFDDNILINSEVVILWNPLINKCVLLPLPFPSDTTFVGFGVCPVTFDPTVVKILYGDLKDSLHWKVEVFTLSSGTWKSLTSRNLPRKTVYLQIHEQCCQVLIDRFIYWDACEARIVAEDAKPQDVNLIVSFDMTTHEFEMIPFT